MADLLVVMSAAQRRLIRETFAARADEPEIAALFASIDYSELEAREDRRRERAYQRTLARQEREEEQALNAQEIVKRWAQRFGADYCADHPGQGYGSLETTHSRRMTGLPLKQNAWEYLYGLARARLSGSEPRPGLPISAKEAERLRRELDVVFAEDPFARDLADRARDLQGERR